MTANAVTRSTLTPSRLVQVAAANPAVWYPMHDGAGTSVAEALGLGPTMTLAGTTPANGWANAGAYTPNGTDNYASCPSNAYLDSAMGLANIATSGMILCGFEIQFPAASATQQYINFWGRDSATAGFGGWGLYIAPNSSVNILVRGVTAASSDNTPIGVQVGDTHAQPKRVLVTMWFEAGYLRLECRMDSNIGTNQIDCRAITLPGAASDGGVLMMRRNGVTPTQSPLGGGATGARLNNFFCQRRTQYSSLISSAAYADMLAAGREFPRALRG
jgi:hypothetical protein